MVRLQGQADAATGMVATDAGLEAASLPAGCHGRVASFAQSDLGGSDAPPRHLPLWESQPLLAPASPLLPYSGESLLAAAATPSDAAAALAFERRSRVSLPDRGWHSRLTHSRLTQPAAPAATTENNHGGVLTAAKRAVTVKGHALGIAAGRGRLVTAESLWR